MESACILLAVSAGLRELFSGADSVTVIMYGLAVAYFFAAFPGLARNTPTIREHAEKYSRGEITREEYVRHFPEFSLPFCSPTYCT